MSRQRQAYVYHAGRRLTGQKSCEDQSFAAPLGVALAIGMAEWLWPALSLTIFTGLLPVRGTTAGRRPAAEAWGPDCGV